MCAKKCNEEITKEILKEAEYKMGLSKAKLLLKQPFYGVLVSMLDFIPDSSIPTMATNSSKIFYNPKFTVELPEEEIFGVLLHEISHCVYLHCTSKRRLNRDSKMWNYAIDFAVNLEISDIGYSLPKNLLLDYKYKNMNAEQIYDKLNEEAEKNPEKIENLQTFDTHIEDADSSNWDDMEDKIISAYEMSKNIQDRGNVPAGIKRWVDKLRKNRVKWERIFWKYVGTALAKDDYSYTRVNKRYLGQDIYLPDLRNNIIGNVVVAIDTSGSISKECLQQFAAEVKKIGHLVNEITCITCDADIHEVVKIHKFQNFLDKLKFMGGGGTSHKPVFEYIQKYKLNPELFIGFSDMYSDINEIKPPTYPVLWVSTSEIDKAKFGKVIQIPNDKYGE